jgi:fructose-bisphosphate aldolase class 1
MEFAAQMLNALNHPQFVLNRLNDILSGGTTSSTVQNILKPQTANFNQPQTVLASNARAIQLYLKVVF